MRTHAASSAEYAIDSMPWIERARSMAGYYDEAMDFIRRAQPQHPVENDDAYPLMRLWVQADQLDELILTLLQTLNAELLGGVGELDTTRSVNGYSEDGERRISYECGWALTWGRRRRGVNVTISFDADGIFYAYAAGVRSAFTQRIGYPVTESALQDALCEAYVRETTARLFG